MKRPHLASALLALGLLLGLLIGFGAYAEWTEIRYIHVVAPLRWYQKTAGGALERAAFRQPDLLPVYGSSELRAGASDVGRDLFGAYPSGFMIFPISWPQIGPLSMALILAASDGACRGKKLVISLSPAYFSIATPSYEGDFSDLNANELAFSTQLSLALKRRFAQRMLQYPKTLQSDHILRFALEQLAADTYLHTGMYYLTFPLGRLQLWVFRLQEHWTVLQLLAERPRNPQVIKQPRPLDWTQLTAQLSQKAEQQANNNPFGFNNDYWQAHQTEIVKRKNDWPDPQFNEALHSSPSWTDLDLLLRTLQELGVHPLLLSVPMKGDYYDYRGNSAAVRKLYYKKLNKFGRRYAVPVFTFEEHENDKYFISDNFDHLSEKGWAYYAQAMDDFYHDRLHESAGK